LPRLERTQDERLNTLEILERGEVDVLGRLPFSSNYVFLVRVSHEGEELHAVYKPSRGERPLRDFPAGTLAVREVATFRVAEAAGWPVVPPTVMRADGPIGPGSLQVFVDHDPNRHYFVLVHEWSAEMATFAALDIVINNADRKAGHILEDSDGHLWGVDHGLTFNVDPKLRTVIWAFAEQEIPAAVRSRLEGLAQNLAPGSELDISLNRVLSAEEVEETRARLALLLADGVFPSPEGPFSMPWPLV
jgi:hypothetical protein